MTSPFEWGDEPDPDDLQSGFEGDKPLTEAEHVGVIVLAGELGAFEAPAEGATDAFDFVCYHRFAVPRTTEHNTALELSTRDPFGGWPNEQRIIHPLTAISTEV